MHKILIIDLHCDALLPSGLGEFGGGNTYSKSVVSAIVKTNIDCIYITRKKMKTLSDEELVAPNLKYIRIEINQDEIEDKDTLFLHSDEIYHRIYNIITNLNFVPNLIHSIYWPSGIIAIKLCNYYKIPFIHTVLSNGKRKLLQSGNYEIASVRIKYEKECFQKAQYIICSSLYERNDINKLYNIPLEKLILTGLEVENAFLNPSYDRSGNYKLNTISLIDTPYISIDESSHTTPSLWWNKGAFLYYGRLHPDKGILEIINSWIELKQKYPQLPVLWIAGGSPEQIHKLRKLIFDQKALTYYEEAQEIIWWGRLSAEGLSTLMLKTLVLVTHSRYESGGLMILEALAHGIPVIATPFGYANDYIQDWENGFIIPFQDCTTLKHRMLHFMYQPFLSAIMGQQANLQYKKVAKEFDFSNKHIKLYQQKIIGTKLSTEKTSAMGNRLPYPLADYIPSDDEVLSLFMQHIQNNTWDSNPIIFLEKTEDYEQYCVWTITYSEQIYQCFRWKNYINTDRIYLNKASYYYTREELTRTDQCLYHIGACHPPINMTLKYDISIHILSSMLYVHCIKETFETLFYSLNKVQLELDTIDFQRKVLDSKEMLQNYGYNIENTALSVYKFLRNINLDYEELGLVPKNLYPHSLINNQFIHIGQLCIGSQSYFYAKYLLFCNITEQKNIQHFININNIPKQLNKNILCWILNLRFYEFSKSIIHEATINTDEENQLSKLLALLE